VLAPKGQSGQGADQDDAILAPATTVLDRLSGGRFIQMVLASALTANDLGPAQEEMRVLLRESHRLQQGDDDDFTIRNQTEIANTLGILRPNFVAMLDGLESRDLCARMRSTNDRRSHILVLTDKGRAVLARAKKLVATKHEARLNELLGPQGRVSLLEMLSKIALEF
jgi:DNA-binding MarR family transcriptional regulator